MKVDMVLRVANAELEIPNGTYRGVHDGYLVFFQTGFSRYRLEVDEGVRGPVQVEITVDNGDFQIERIVK